MYQWLWLQAGNVLVLNRILAIFVFVCETPVNAWFMPELNTGSCTHLNPYRSSFSHVCMVMAWYSQYSETCKLRRWPSQNVASDVSLRLTCKWEYSGRMLLFHTCNRIILDLKLTKILTLFQIRCACSQSLSTVQGLQTEVLMYFSLNYYWFWILVLSFSDVYTENPDEKSIITYVVAFYHYFSKMKALAVEGKRVGKVSVWERHIFTVRQ